LSYTHAGTDVVVVSDTVVGIGVGAGVSTGTGVVL
jgi:hypothetical protein